MSLPITGKRLGMPVGTQEAKRAGATRPTFREHWGRRLRLAHTRNAMATPRTILIAGLLASISSMGRATSVPNPPPTLSDRASFDCAKAESTVVKILCRSHEGATADWDLNATLWAVAGTLTEARQKSFNQDQDRWRGWLNNKCLQPRPVASDISREQQKRVR